MFSTIVLGLDGSDASEAAVPVAAELARLATAEIVVVHVEERIAARGGVEPAHLDQDELTARIEATANELRAAGGDVRVEIAVDLIGGPARAIAEVATQVQADIVVVGSRGHSGLAGVLLGSVAQKLLHLAPCPVLVVPAR
jgi:nucleotide-binding universal stress UspA family protein